MILTRVCEVIARCRPLNRREIARGEVEVARVLNSNLLMLTTDFGEGKAGLPRRNRQNQFEFDHILDRTASQVPTKILVKF